MKKEALRVVATVPVAPTTLYFAWLDSDQHSAMTGSAAKLSNEVGQKYTALDGYVTGKLITADLGRRMVMSWRTPDFPRDAADSRVEVNLEALGPSTRVTVIQTEIPEGQSEQYRSVWNDKYFTPMRNHFSKFLPDPRNPPPPRRPPPPEETDEEETPPANANGKGGGKGKLGKAPPPPAKGKGPSIAKVEAKSGKKLAPPPPAKKAAPPPPKPTKKVAAPPAKKAPPAKPAPKKKSAPPAKPAPKKKSAPPAKPAKKPAAKPAKKKKK